MTRVSSLYVHVPFCRHLCNYCDFYKRKLEAHDEQWAEYEDFLDRSWSVHESVMAEHGAALGPLETLYLGGGTPSLWGARGARVFRDLVLARAPLASGAEFTMEVDPGAWEAELFPAWEELGLNRVSIGTQTLDPNFLRIMDRAHSLEESHRLLSQCADRKMNFSLDFLLGIPFSEEKGRSVIKELETLLSYGPSHVSLYILNARSKYPHVSAIPKDDYIREEYLAVSEFLRGQGFHHYEVSNFSLPGLEARHNERYWRSESVAALGPTGSGFLGISREKALRYKWKVSRPEVEIEVLDAQALDLEETYLSLRTSRGWRPRHRTSNLTAVFQRWEQADYGRFDGETMRLNSLGFLMLDSLMNDLFLLK